MIRAAGASPRTFRVTGLAPGAPCEPTDIPCHRARARCSVRAHGHDPSRGRQPADIPRHRARTRCSVRAHGHSASPGSRPVLRASPRTFRVTGLAPGALSAPRCSIRAPVLCPGCLRSKGARRVALTGLRVSTYVVLPVVRNSGPYVITSPTTGSQRNSLRSVPFEPPCRHPSTWQPARRYRK